MTIETLTTDRIPDWLDFFERRAFADHDEWQGCSCTAFFFPKPDAYPAVTNRRKDYALWLIETGRVVGWVNANHRRHFPRLGGLEPHDEKVLSIVCFLVEKDHRAKGIATALLARLTADAHADGYTAVEAYPKKGAKSEYGRWNGPYEMYRKACFVDAVIGTTKVVRHG